MKRNVRIEEQQSDGLNCVTIYRNGKEECNYSYFQGKEYKHPLLSTENLSYSVTENDEDEEDDDGYLLGSVKANKKICATFWTSHPEKIVEAYSGSDLYCHEILNTWKEEYKNVVIAKNGTMRDFYDLDEILDWYTANNQININESIIEQAFDTPIIDIAVGRFSPLGPYNYVMDFNSPDVTLQKYKAAGLVISGLLLGYPLEATNDLIKSLWAWFF